jgi:hypothetical protein
MQDEFSDFKPYKDEFADFKPYTVDQKAASEASEKAALADLDKRLQSGDINFIDLPKDIQLKYAKSQRSWLGDRAQNFADTASFGFADNIASNLDALLGYGGKGDFASRKKNTLAYQDALDQSRYSEESKIATVPLKKASFGLLDDQDITTGTVERLAGNIAGGAGIGRAGVRAGDTVAGAGLRAFAGVGGKTLPEQIVRGAGSGALQGGVTGFNTSRADTNLGTIVDTLQGSAIGLGVGGGSPVVGRGVSKTADVVGSLGRRIGEAAGFIKPLPAMPFDSMGRGARDYLAETMADPKTIAQTRQGLQELGGQATLADISPEMLGVAQGAQAIPGQRGRVIDLYKNRDLETGARLRQSLDSNLGKEPDSDAIMRGLKQERQAMYPEYDAALQNSQPVDAMNVVAMIDAALPNSTASQSSRLMRLRKELVKEVDIGGQKAIIPEGNAQKIHNVYKELGAELEKNKIAAGGAGVAEDLNFYDAQKGLSDALEAASSGFKDLNRRYARTFADEEAFNLGVKSFKKGGDSADTILTPKRYENLINEAKTATPNAVPMIKQGQRLKISQIVNDNVNDLSALRNSLGEMQDGNAQKFIKTFGDDAKKVLKDIDRENVFRDTKNQIVGGSRTANALGFKEFLEKQNQGAGKIPRLGAVEFAIEGMNKALQKITETGNKARSSRFAGDLVDVATAQGVDAEKVLKALESLTGRQKKIYKRDSLAQQGGLIYSRTAADQKDDKRKR